MKLYLETLIPRLRSFSKKLDNLAIFVNQPWLQVDDSGERRLYVFRSENNELLVSHKGNVHTCRWEYLDYLGSLLIEIQESKSLYNQGFLDDAVMILKKDDSPEYLILVNENKLEDHSIIGVLENLQCKYLSPATPQEPIVEVPDYSDAIRSHNFQNDICKNCTISRSTVEKSGLYCEEFKRSRKQEKILVLIVIGLIVFMIVFYSAIAL